MIIDVFPSQSNSKFEGQFYFDPDHYFVSSFFVFTFGDSN